MVSRAQPGRTMDGDGACFDQAFGLAPDEYIEFLTNIISVLMERLNVLILSSASMARVEGRMILVQH
jgi:hypothetical protein